MQGDIYIKRDDDVLKCGGLTLTLKASLADTDFIDDDDDDDDDGDEDDDDEEDEDGEDDGERWWWCQTYTQGLPCPIPRPSWTSNQSRQFQRTPS